MLQNEKLLHLVELIYDAALDPSLWPVFLEALAELIDGAGTVLFALQPSAPLRSVSAQTRFDPLLIERYLSEFADNIWVRRADAQFAPSEVRYASSLTTRKELACDRYHADFLAPARIDDSIGLKIFYGAEFPAYLATSRPNRKAPFSQWEGDIFLALEPHIRRALALNSRIAETLAFTNVLEAHTEGLILVNHPGQPVWWNRQAESIFRSRDGLWVDSRGGFRTARLAETDRLQDLIRKAVMTDMPATGEAMSVSRPSLRRPYAILVCPVRTQSTTLHCGGAAVFVADPSQLPATSAQRLAEQFRLTRAEARVAAKLVEGKSPEMSADELSLSQATVRTHIRSLFTKTSTRRLPELVRILLTGPARGD